MINHIEKIIKHFFIFYINWREPALDKNSIDVKFYTGLHLSIIKQIILIINCNFTICLQNIIVMIQCIININFLISSNRVIRLIELIYIMYFI